MLTHLPGSDSVLAVIFDSNALTRIRGQVGKLAKSLQAFFSEIEADQTPMHRLKLARPPELCSCRTCPRASQCGSQPPVAVHELRRPE